MTNWRAYLIGGLLFVMTVMSGFIVKLQTDKKAAEEEAAAAKAQSTISEGTVQAVDRLLIEERRITEEVTNVVREIDALPSSKALVPDDVVAVWANGIDGLRDSADPANDPDPGKPERLP